MIEPPEEARAAQLRWAVYWLLIAVAVGNMTARLMTVNALDRVGLEKYLKGKDHPNWRQQRPFLSANDRSRWANVRALVEHSTYAIDDVVKEPLWDTIDQVKHADRDGERRLYSSKPPLLATLVAGEYWVIYQITGETLGTHPYSIGRFMLVTINILPLILMYFLIARLVERFAETDWARLFIMACATLGTLLTPFAIVLNNHVPAAVSVAVALYATVCIWFDDERRWRYFVIGGLAAAFAAACELPALSLLAAIGVAVLWKAPRRALLGFAPAALVVIGAYFGTNYIAHNSLRPPYMHRAEVSPGEVNSEANWYVYTYERNGKLRESYWMNRRGVDRGEPSRAVYALHMLVGHHGVFSLTPVWLLSFAGLAMWVSRGDSDRRLLAVMIGLLSLVCIAFYIARPRKDRNYGGATCGFRWLFWFAPLWLVAMCPAADAMSRRRATRGVAYVLLALSVFSATAPIWNPWQHPWLYNTMVDLGWIQAF